MLLLVPNQLREASYALGATKARVTLTVVLPAAIGGIVSGALLAVARAAGETAPLLFVILSVESTNPNLFSGPNTALSTQIFANAQSPYVGAEARAWGAALHAHRHLLPPDDHRPHRHRTVHPLHPVGTLMEQPEQEVVEQTVSTNLPRLETTVKAPSLTPGTAIFDVQNVSIYYGAFKAVTDVSLPVYENEVTAFIGSSGSGKSTVLRAFNRMNDLVTGRAGRRRDALPRHGPLRQGSLARGGPPPHRHGLPEAEPVPQVDLRQRRLRAADQRHQRNKASLDEIVEKLAAQRGAVGRGEEPAQAVRSRPVRRPGAAAVHRPHDRGRAGRRADGRARLGPRPDRHRSRSRT